MNRENSSDPVEITRAGRRLGPPSRREAMQWVMAAVAASSLPASAFAQRLPSKEGKNNIPQEEAAKVPNPERGGYGTDPNLVKLHQPGDFWPLTFDPQQKAIAKALADTILPQDDLGPAASLLGVVEMVDEWVSAPYPDQQEDRKVVIPGLAWIDAEAAKRFNKGFAAISQAQRNAICDDICNRGKAKAEFRQGAEFFSQFRSLCAGAYYATPPGWDAIGYVGNVALPSFPGPPQEVLDKLGLVQTVKDA